MDASHLPLTMDRADAVTASGFGATTIRKALASGELPSVLIEGQRRIITADLVNWIVCHRTNKPLRDTDSPHARAAAVIRERKNAAP